jgi:hypothetical protein
MAKIITFKILKEYEQAGSFVLATPGEIFYVMNLELVQDVPHLHLMINDQVNASIEFDPRGSMAITQFHIFKTDDRLPRPPMGKLFRHCGGYTRYSAFSPEPVFCHLFREIEQDRVNHLV